MQSRHLGDDSGALSPSLSGDNNNNRPRRRRRASAADVDFMPSDSGHDRGSEDEGGDSDYAGDEDCDAHAVAAAIGGGQAAGAARHTAARAPRSARAPAKAPASAATAGAGGGRGRKRAKAGSNAGSRALEAAAAASKALRAGKGPPNRSGKNPDMLPAMRTEAAAMVRDEPNRAVPGLTEYRAIHKKVEQRSAAGGGQPFSSGTNASNCHFVFTQVLKTEAATSDFPPLADSQPKEEAELHVAGPSAGPGASPGGSGLDAGTHAAATMAPQPGGMATLATPQLATPATATHADGNAATGGAAVGSAEEEPCMHGDSSAGGSDETLPPDDESMDVAPGGSGSESAG